MSGHSKWANIQHRKGRQDAKRSNLWTKLVREIIVAARVGGSGDPDMNSRLRQAIAKAREGNVPKDTIQNAILKGTGQLEGVSYEEIRYEGYGVGGASLIIDCTTDNRTRTVIIPEEGLVLTPGKLYLGRTNEWTETYGLVPKLEGRSSIGRLGLFIHVTAGYGDVGFRGYWTLEIVAVEPIRIYPNMQIGQLSYHPVCGEVVNQYQGKYQDSREVVASQIWREMQ